MDLNPIRAAIADTPENSDFTSIQERLGIKPEQPVESSAETQPKEPLPLAELIPFSGGEHQHNQPNHLPFDLSDYLELVDWSGRAIRDDKRGAIDKALPNILERLGLPSKDWLDTCCNIESHFGRAIGPVAKVSELCESVNVKWMHGIRNCKRLYPKTG
ncbi:hypothetical protein QWI17_14690 [Gilvimarinus sp. SDUM040013]|uniref:Transposase n=1 Tax=Gilvimarinus gilvus TaxID=3058038 RepID=A0ABU4RTM3_9GAMM|nr:hypothetical protein [Gilvimarinus sp. SDUM040013]MDO3387091.1 hypothetical protein [Gilvimarinus sp. SDUM040013]MDX6848014.1 hypothetical protein [Gilvimarinus sp. SDUM040013]